MSNDQVEAVAEVLRQPQHQHVLETRQHGAADTYCAKRPVINGPATCDSRYSQMRSMSAYVRSLRLPCFKHPMLLATPEEPPDPEAMTARNMCRLLP